MRRIVILLAVVALMVGMLAMSVAPAFGQPQVIQGCFVRPNFVLLTNASDFPSLDQKDRNDDDILCGYGTRQGTHFTDNSH